MVVSTIMLCDSYENVFSLLFEQLLLLYFQAAMMLLDLPGLQFMAWLYLAIEPVFMMSSLFPMIVWKRDKICCTSILNNRPLSISYPTLHLIFLMIFVFFFLIFLIAFIFAYGTHSMQIKLGGNRGATLNI